MDSFSRSNNAFEEDDDDDEEFVKGEGSSQNELAVKLDGRSSDQKANRPRSKHSATEQRRRNFKYLEDFCQIVTRKEIKHHFFLSLQVIEYIRFLHEKVQKYESLYPGWNDENTKMMPWNNHQSSAGIDDVSIIKTVSAPGFVVSDNGIPVTPAMLYTSLNVTKSAELISGLSYNSLENCSGFINKVDASHASLHPRLYSIGREPSRSQTDQTMATEANNLASQSQWMRPSSPGDCAVSNEKLNEHEDLTIDEGTIRVSCAYSQVLLNNLSESLQNSGIDLSHTNLSVQINLGRRAGGRRHNP